METIKAEPTDYPNGPEGLLQTLEVQIPTNFERDEWIRLTEGFATEHDEVSYILSLRGQGGSQKGRPTNFKSPYKGDLSNSSHAIAQRTRAALRTEEESAIRSAKDADRSAKYQLKRALGLQSSYKEKSKAQQHQELQAAEDVLAQKRFDTYKSAEWLEDRLMRAHNKWKELQLEIDLRAHQKALMVLEVPAPQATSSSTPSAGRGAQRVYGKYGIADKIMRDVYQNGLKKLTTNTFENKLAKEEWESFRDGLEPLELALVQDQTWASLHEPKTILDSLEHADNIELHGYKPFIEGDDSDECEEEVDDDSEIDEYYKRLPNEYDSDVADDKERIDEDDELTDFEGFSD